MSTGLPARLEATYLSPDERAFLEKYRTGLYRLKAIRALVEPPDLLYKCNICGAKRFYRDKDKLSNSRYGWRFCSKACLGIARQGSGRTFASANPVCELRYCDCGDLCRVERRPSGSFKYLCPSCQPPRRQRTGPRRVFVEGPCALCGSRFIGYKRRDHVCCSRNKRDRAKGLLRGYRLSICERDGWRCQLCGEMTTGFLWRAGGSPHGATIDHIVRVVDGGTDEASNLRCACWICNWQREIGEPYEEPQESGS